MLFDKFQLVLPVETAAYTVVEMALASITVLLLWMQAVSGQSGCETGAFVYKSHTWNKGDTCIAEIWICVQSRARNLTICQLWDGVDQPIFDRLSCS